MAWVSILPEENDATQVIQYLRVYKIGSLLSSIMLFFLVKSSYTKCSRYYIKFQNLRWSNGEGHTFLLLRFRTYPLT